MYNELTMEPEELPKQGASKLMLLSVGSLIVITVAIIAIVLFARDRVEEARDVARSNALQEETEQTVVTGRIGLLPKGDASQIRRGETVTMFVYADSQEQEITGYDAVLRYDPAQLEFDSVISVLEGMDIYETEEALESGQNELIITGIQSLSQSEPFVFNNTALAEVTFNVLQSGEADIEIVYEPGSHRESNLITPRNQDILSTVVGATLEVQ